MAGVQIPNQLSQVALPIVGISTYFDQKPILAYLTLPSSFSILDIERYQDI